MGKSFRATVRAKRCLVFKRALGVTTGILPWNFPFFLIARKLAPCSPVTLSLSSRANLPKQRHCVCQNRR
ncbi:aldehyde dehydrogenase family protein [Enterobacter hormaechei]